MVSGRGAGRHQRTACRYYIPWIDNLLDKMASPAAVVDGVVATAACISQVNDPALQWSVAIIAGRGTAGVVQGTTVIARGTSTATTGGWATLLFPPSNWRCLSCFRS